MTYDQNRISIYSESALREVTLNWTLAPNNQNESRKIHQIVKELKRYSSAQSIAGGIMLKSPHYFRLKFTNEILDNALQFHEVAMTDIRVSYAPGGGMEMHYDGTPKTINLSISFRDREPKLLEDWDKNFNKGSKSGSKECAKAKEQKGK
jgi:hypothetical protein